MCNLSYARTAFAEESNAFSSSLRWPDGTNDAAGIAKNSQGHTQNNAKILWYRKTKEIIEMVRGEETVSERPKKDRWIQKTPFKVLDAPELTDDFYLNLVDWSKLNVLAVGLNRSVYIWSACTSNVARLCEVPENDAITSVCWSQKGNYLSVGTYSGKVQIWDAASGKLVRTMKGHLSRVGVTAWNHSTLASGSRDRMIQMRDIRSPDDFFDQYLGHKQEVCGMKWSFDNSETA